MRGIGNVALLFEHAGELGVESGGNVVRVRNSDRTGRFFTSGRCGNRSAALGNGRHEACFAYGSDAFVIALPGYGFVVCIFRQYGGCQLAGFAYV